MALPGLIEQLKATPLGQTPEVAEKIRTATEQMGPTGGAVTPEAACKIFGLLAEIQGLPPGSEELVNVIPDPKNPQSMSAQMCAKGRYVSVMVARPGLEYSEGAAERLLDLARSVLGR